jgi:hypothetical protein
MTDQSVPLDQYEEGRYSENLHYERNRQDGDDNNKDRRNSGGANGWNHSRFLLSRTDREAILIEWGVPFHEMIDAIRINVKIKNQRRRTVHAIGKYDRFEEMMEQTASTLKRKLKMSKNNNSNTSTAVKEEQKTASNNTQRRKQNANHPKRGTTSSSLDGFGSDNSVEGGSSAISASSSSSFTSRLGFLPSVRSRAQTTTANSEVNDLSTYTSSQTNGLDGTSTAAVRCESPSKKELTSSSIPRITSLPDCEVIMSRSIPTNDISMSNIQNTPHRRRIRSHSLDHVRDNSHVPQTDIGVATSTGIPEMVQLQRTLSIESILTMDVRLMSDPNISRYVDDEDAYDEYLQDDDDDDDESTVQFDEACDSDAAEIDETPAAHNNELSDNERDLDDTSVQETECLGDEDDMTMTSAFMREFSELMVGDGHPSAFQKTVQPISKPESPRMMRETVTEIPPPENDSSPALLAIDRNVVTPENYELALEINVNINDEYISESFIGEEYGEIHLEQFEPPLSPISEFTGGNRFHNGVHTQSTSSSSSHNVRLEDGDFDILQRDSSFWEMRPGQHDAPQIQRKVVPIVIQEDAGPGDFWAMDDFENHPNVLSRIPESEPYLYTGPGGGYPLDVENMPYRYQHSLPHPTHEHVPMLNGGLMLQPQFLLPAGTPLDTISEITMPNMNYPPVKYHQDITINRGMIYPHPSTGHFETPLPPLTMVPAQPHYPLHSSNAGVAGYDRFQYVRDEPKYNRVNDRQMQFLKYNDSQPLASHLQHHTMYNNDPATLFQDTYDVRNTKRWEDHGFRMQPPPNSSAAMFHKMMM